MTEAQVEYERKLRDFRAAEARVDTASPLSENDKQWLLKKHGSIEGPSAIQKAEFHRESRHRAMGEAGTDLHYEEVRCATSLGRALTVHERESGFSGSIEHRWWLTSTAPCATCLPNDDPTEDPRARVKRLLSKVTAQTAMPLPPEEPDPYKPRPEDARRESVRAAMNAYLGERPHSEACECYECIPPEEPA